MAAVMRYRCSRGSREAKACSGSRWVWQPRIHVWEPIAAMISCGFAVLEVAFVLS